MLFLAAGLSVVMTSCFNVYETFWFNPNGSGSMEMQMDVSQMVDLMGGFAEGIDSAGGSDMNDMFTDMGNFDALIALQSQGISNVVSLNDSNTKIIGYRFDFANVDALNRALRVVKNDIDGTSGPEGDAAAKDWVFFEYDGKTMKRTLPSREPAPKETGEDEMGADMAKNMFKDAEYVVTYFFNEKSIRQCKSPGAEISDDKVSVKMNVDLAKMVESGEGLNALVKLK